MGSQSSPHPNTGAFTRNTTTYYYIGIIGMGIRIGGRLRRIAGTSVDPSPPDPDRMHYPLYGYPRTFAEKS